MTTPKPGHPRTTPASPPGEPPAFRLSLHLPVAVADQPWTARLEGVTPEGHLLRPREFRNPGDLTAFLRSLVTSRGLR